MAKKSAVKKETSKKKQTSAPAKKAAARKKTAKAPAKKTTAKKSAPKKSRAKKVTPKAIKALVTKGKKQGYLTYDEINEALPEDMLAPEQLDETLILLDTNNIAVVDKKHKKQ